MKSGFNYNGFTGKYGHLRDKSPFTLDDENIIDFIKMRNKKYLSLIIWIIALLAIGSIIGSITKPEVDSWYRGLQRSSLTPPNYVFPVAWTILYAIIGICGWLIWSSKSLPVTIIKTLYITQLILNWSWTPLFFYYHLTGLALIILFSMDLLVGALICVAYTKIRSVSLLMVPYLCWLLFASYLNLYIWLYN